MTTKYNIDDAVWIMYDGIPTKVIIFNITINHMGENIYTIPVYGNTMPFKEAEVFPTKRDLLNSFLTEKDKL